MKKSEANIEDLRNQTVSWGTHRPDDLIPKFLAVLKEYGKEAYDKYVSENPEVEDWKMLDDETKGWVVDELFDLLDGIAPEDCYFGAHPGDGADFGFWQVDESKRKDSKKSESDTADAEQVFTDMADSLGISDRSVITTDGDRVKFVLKLKLKDLEDYAWEYNPKLKVVKNIASPTADAFDGARKTVNTVEDAAAWLKGGIEELLNMEKEAIDLVGNESKKSEADGYKDIFTLDLTRIDAEGDEEGLDDMQAAQNFYDEDEAIQAAKDLADSYKDDDDVVQVTVMAGEQEKPNGDIVGEPFDIFTASSSDSATTAKYREKANYTVTDGLDYYAKGGKSEAKKSEDFDMNQAFFQAKKAITDWTKRQGHKTLEWLYTDGRKSPTSYPSGIWDFEWDTGNGMATAELKVSPYETRTNSWNDSMDFSLRVGTEDKPTFYTSVEDVLSALDTLISETEESKKSEGGDDKDCKGKDCKDDITNKNEADATFKVGDFVTYDAASDGKEDFINQYVSAEIAEINDDGSLVLWIYDLDDGWNDVNDADPQFCTKLDHYAGKVDADHYYMDGPYKAYKGGWEILITKKDLNPRVYEFIGTMDDLGEVLDVDAYYGGENFVFDEDLKDEVANNTVWDVETTTFADMTGDVGESKQTEAKKKYYGYGKDDAIDKEDTDFMWQVAYDWFEDRLPEKLKRWASTAVINVIDKDSRAYEEIVTMDDYHAYLQKYGPSVIKDIKANDESKQTEGLPPKKLGNRLYRSRADLINKMKTLDAVEITTPAQFNDIHSKQWLHTAGYAMDINGNLVGQTYFGDKDGKWYYATTKTFQGDYLPECKEEAKKGENLEPSIDIRNRKNVELPEMDYLTLSRDINSSGYYKSSGGTYIVYVGGNRLGEFPDIAAAAEAGFVLKESKKSESLNPVSVDAITKDDFDAYVAVQRSGKYNMIMDADATADDADLDIDTYYGIIKNYGALVSKYGRKGKSLSESLTLKQKELKNMARYGEATDITTISDAEAKELKKKGIETVGISRGAYGMNGALLRDNEGNKYVITARSSNLFYFV